MKISRYFANLKSSYNAELDDLRTDSEGNNVLKARLAKKREQVPQLLMMMQSAPEMVAVAFHGGFFFKNVMVLEALVTREENKFPTWETLKKAIILEPWAQALVNIVLTDPDGEAFLITTAGLEYLNRSSQSRAAHPSNADEDEHSADHEDQDDDLHDHEHDNEHDDDNNDAYLNSDERVADEGETTEYDLDKAGANWLAEQGFDRKE
ncbi:hypothetical protein [Solimicrobium silvestre]|uniref:Uncharacterized protein n=1 Tax=Solimicrobium silvestre TaxID=2099400 RepID=A0A2S9GV40_9BURK|nr:hypothetical protein [Solimicrobium silvestre]PRC91595.1 hypothetical protein S2091_3711 [Solimicrobium silvestre]